MFNNLRSLYTVAQWGGRKAHKIPGEQENGVGGFLMPESHPSYPKQNLNGWLKRKGKKKEKRQK